MMVNSKMVSNTVLACTSRQALAYTKGTGTWAIGMPMASLHSQMVINIRENTIMVRGKAMEFLLGQTDKNMMDPLRMARSMASVSYTVVMDRSVR